MANLSGARSTFQQRGTLPLIPGDVYTFLWPPAKWQRLSSISNLLILSDGKTRNCAAWVSPCAQPKSMRISREASLREGLHIFED